MSDLTFDEKLRSAYRDLDLIKSGWRPGPEVEAVPLDGWYPVSHRGLDLPALAGWADHPRLGQTIITTSPVLWIDEGRTIARCLSRWYRLGEPRSHFLSVPLTGWDDVEDLRRRVENAVAMSVKQYRFRGIEGEGEGES